MEHRSGGPGKGWNNPNPIGRTAVSESDLVLQMFHERLRSCVVVNYCDAFLLETVENRYVAFH